MSSDPQEQEEEYHEFEDSDEEEEDEDGEGEGKPVDISDIKSTPSKALRPSLFKDRVFILRTGGAQKLEKMRIVTLPHPVKGTDLKYLIFNKQLLELQKMIEDPSSWFIDSNVEKDGSLFLATPVDPLFIALPFLEKSRRKTPGHDGYFSDSIFNTDAWTDVQRDIKLDLTQICDEKTIGEDITVHRLNDALTITWLRKKIVRLMAKITGDTGVVATGTASVSTFVRTRAVRPPTVEETFTAATGFLGEYVSAEWLTLVKEAFGDQIPKSVAPPDVANVVPLPNNGRSAFDDDDDDDDRSAKRFKKTPTKPAPSTPKTSAKANKLAAAAKGSGTISSFFKKK